MKKLIVVFLSLIYLSCVAYEACAGFFTWRYREHATDCTSLTDGKSTDACYEIDDESLYKCQPTSGDCDTPEEWVLINGASGSGDVVGPASSTDNAIARYDSTTGKLLQNSTVILDDSGNISGVNNLTATNAIILDSPTDAIISVDRGSNGSNHNAAFDFSTAGVTKYRFGMLDEHNNSDAFITLNDASGNVMFDVEDKGTYGRFSSGDLIASVNVGIGATSFGTNADKVLGIANGTIPASSPADMVQVYAQDVSVSTGYAAETAFYTMDDNAASTTVTDSSGNSYTGTNAANTNTKSVAGKISTALSYNGTSDRTAISDTSALRPQAGNASISAWVDLPNSNQFGPILCKRLTSGAFTNFNLAVTGSTFATSGKRIGISLAGSNGGSRTTITNADVADGNPHHVAVTWNATTGTITIYIDGSAVAATSSSSGSWPTIDNTDTMYIGNNNGTAYLTADYVDDVRFFVGTAISATQVSYLYNSGNGRSTASPTTSTSSQLKVMAEDGSVTTLSNNASFPGTVTATGAITTSSTVSATGANLSALTASEIVATDAAKNLQSLAVATWPSLTELSYLKGVTSAVQTQLNAKQPLDSDLTTIAGLTATTDNFIQSKSSAWSSRTPTQVTADLIAFVGDSGSGGTKGLVPAPATGDAAAGKYLKADGTWAVPPGGGVVDFIDLGDVPSSYTGEANKYVVVNGTEDGLVFTSTATGLVGADTRMVYFNGTDNPEETPYAGYDDSANALVLGGSGVAGWLTSYIDSGTTVALNIYPQDATANDATGAAVTVAAGKAGTSVGVYTTGGLLTVKGGDGHTGTTSHGGGIIVKGGNGDGSDGNAGIVTLGGSTRNGTGSLPYVYAVDPMVVGAGGAISNMLHVYDSKQDTFAGATLTNAASPSGYTQSVGIQYYMPSAASSPSWKTILSNPYYDTYQWEVLNGSLIVFSVDESGTATITNDLIISGDSITINTATLNFPSSNAAGFAQNDGSGNITWASSATSPAGSNYDIQFNNSGSFGAISTATGYLNWTGSAWSFNSVFVPPSNASGYLKNDGSGNFSWDNPTASAAGSNNDIQINSSGSLGNISTSTGFLNWNGSSWNFNAVPATGVISGTTLTFDATNSGSVTSLTINNDGQITSYSTL